MDLLSKYAAHIASITRAPLSDPWMYMEKIQECVKEPRTKRKFFGLSEPQIISGEYRTVERETEVIGRHWILRELYSHSEEIVDDPDFTYRSEENHRRKRYVLFEDGTLKVASTWTNERTFVQHRTEVVRSYERSVSPMDAYQVMELDRGFEYQTLNNGKTEERGVFNRQQVNYNPGGGIRSILTDLLKATPTR
ncbi:hypothetical protein ACTXJE_18670 [Glutamicibacter ardleyensis]